MLVSPHPGNQGQGLQATSPVAMKKNVACKSTTIFVSTFTVTLICLLLACASALAQDPATPGNAPVKPKETKPASKNTAKPPFTLTVKTQPILNFSLKAEKAKLSEIAAALAKRLKFPVLLGPTMEAELISTEFSELTLEPAMQLLAPFVYIDYEITTGMTAEPRPLGIFFYAANQGEPPVTAVVPGMNQSLLIEGDTEEGVEPDTEEERRRQEEQPLRIHFQNNLLTVKSKKQPLVLVLLKIGEHLGIPVDIQYQAGDIVDLELNKTPVEDAIRKLSPSLLMYVRADLTRSERRLLRLTVPEPSKAAQPNF